MYRFLLYMWIMRKINKDFLQEQVEKGRISQEEYKSIISSTHF